MAAITVQRLEIQPAETTLQRALALAAKEVALFTVNPSWPQFHPQILTAAGYHLTATARDGSSLLHKTELKLGHNHGSKSNHNSLSEGLENSHSEYHGNHTILQQLQKFKYETRLKDEPEFDVVIQQETNTLIKPKQKKYVLQKEQQSSEIGAYTRRVLSPRSNHHLNTKEYKKTNSPFTVPIKEESIQKSKTGLKMKTKLTQLERMRDETDLRLQKAFAAMMRSSKGAAALKPYLNNSIRIKRDPITIKRDSTKLKNGLYSEKHELMAKKSNLVAIEAAKPFIEAVMAQNLIRRGRWETKECVCQDIQVKAPICEYIHSDEALLPGTPIKTLGSIHEILPLVETAAYEPPTNSSEDLNTVQKISPAALNTYAAENIETVKKSSTRANFTLIEDLKSHCVPQKHLGLSKLLTDSIYKDHTVLFKNKRINADLYRYQSKLI